MSLRISLAIKAATLAVQLGASFLCGNTEAIADMIEVLNRPWK